MAEYQLSFDGFVRLFFCNGNHHLRLRLCNYWCFYKRYACLYFNVVWAYRSQCFIFFMVFKDKNIWADSPDLTLSVITGFFTATVIFYMFYVLIYYFDRMGAGE